MALDARSAPCVGLSTGRTDRSTRSDARSSHVVARSTRAIAQATAIVFWGISTPGLKYPCRAVEELDSTSPGHAIRCRTRATLGSALTGPWGQGALMGVVPDSRVGKIE